MKRLTPVLVVEKIETSLEFWVNRLGFEVTVKVPEGDQLGFVILQRDNVELMLQTQASVAKDIPNLAEERFHSALYIEVADLDEFRPAIADLPKVFEERRTFYGALEIGMRDPDGNSVTLAQMGTG